MSVEGVCRICSGTARRTCDSCGATVCDDHYDAVSGLCDDCTGGRRFR